MGLRLGVLVHDLGEIMSTDPLGRDGIETVEISLNLVGTKRPRTPSAGMGLRPLAVEFAATLDVHGPPRPGWD